MALTMMIMITILAVTKMVVVVAKSVMAKCEKCVFFKTKQFTKSFFLDFENECKSVSKMI